MKLNFTSLSKLNSSITDVFFPKIEPIILFLRLLQMKQVIRHKYDSSNLIHFIVLPAERQTCLPNNLLNLYSCNVKC